MASRGVIRIRNALGSADVGFDRGPAQPCLLDDVLGVGHLAHHPVRHGQQEALLRRCSKACVAFVGMAFAASLIWRNRTHLGSRSANTPGGEWVGEVVCAILGRERARPVDPLGLAIRNRNRSK